ncbi:hypothetical protein TsFJ059_008835 [Trichoderma semiorbis]|uniref:Fibronectin type-III domain-containing protein n=1 Tax=Trichoderma semiorbis TaxID=1491008 RepID=A0A9P8HEU2_9HYPO|nr:hypothetical protein TsFJ059_008835 [Trichoderma semiorbis]
MIVGDSISQGRNGDFTWRYRLWEWFHNNGVSVNFVGPYTGTVEQDPVQPATPPLPYGQDTQQGPGPVRQLGGYNSGIPSNSGFFNGGNRHFAAWGRQMAQDMSLIQGMVSQYQPDYILLELGFNDVGWFVSDAYGTLQSLTAFIKNARAAKPDIGFAIANIPQRLFIGGRDDLITKTDDYNGALPVTWDPVDGAYGYIVTSGFNGAVSSVFNVTQPMYATTWTAAGIEWFYQVQAFCSDVRSGISAQVTATANPTCAPGPSNVVVRSTADGIDMSWDAVTGYDVDVYGAIYYDQTSQVFLSDYGWSGTSASYHGMDAGDRVEVAVETWATVDGVLCAGLPSGGKGAIVGGIVPGAPTGLKVATINEGATVQLTFDSNPNAYAYGFYTRSLLEPDQPYILGGYTSEVPCIGVTFLFPGAWNFEFCVVAYNGDSSSPMSECVQGPRDITEVNDCPALVVPTPNPDPTPTVTWSIPGASGPASSSSSGAVVYIDPTIWQSPSPTAACEPPCTLILPPWTLSSMTTITFPVVTETIEETYPKTTTGVVTYLTTTITVFITLPPVTTSVIEVSNIILTTATSEIVPAPSRLALTLAPLPQATQAIFTSQLGSRDLSVSLVVVTSVSLTAGAVQVAAVEMNHMDALALDVAQGRKTTVLVRDVKRIRQLPNVITGCFLTATATTTGSYCPLVSIDPTTDDEGDDVDLIGNWGPTVTVTFSESVVVQQTPYPVVSGYVTVAQTAYPISNVKSISTTSLDGTRAVIYPSFQSSRYYHVVAFQNGVNPSIIIHTVPNQHGH